MAYGGFDFLFGLGLSQNFGTFSKEEVEQLMRRVDIYFPPGSYSQIQWIYRDKPERFFDEAARNGGIMTKYIKDRSGDPKSPINGRLNGLFFACNEEYYGCPPEPSYFGNTRIKVPIEFFLSPQAKGKFSFLHGQAVKLYFADFHCMSRTFHWVTLVLTYENSTADEFCHTRLPELNLHSNTFLFIRPDGTVVRRKATNLAVEVFYTEDIDINYWKDNGAIVERVSTAGKGSSTPGGKPKRSNCSICNI